MCVFRCERCWFTPFFLPVICGSLKPRIRGSHLGELLMRHRRQASQGFQAASAVFPRLGSLKRLHRRHKRRHLLGRFHARRAFHPAGHIHRLRVRNAQGIGNILCV